MQISRRKFMSTAALLAGGSAALSTSDAADLRTNQEDLPLFVSTWGFGKQANEKGRDVITQGGSILDAIEQGIRVIEVSGNNSVGLSGRPNSEGVVQLDACIMSGPGHRAGSVAALEGVVHPISAARRVMEKTRHVMLVGDGARQFALTEGLETAKPGAIKPHQVEPEQPTTQPVEESKELDSHDTIALLALAPDGNIAAGCSTSGRADKLPGRVGDSPIVGGGVYVDNEVGAAGATGVGENIMRYCACCMIVEYMRNGMHPEQACIKMIERIAATDPLEVRGLFINFVALDKKGRHGAAGTNRRFAYAVTSRTDSRVLRCVAVTKAP